MLLEAIVRTLASALAALLLCGAAQAGDVVVVKDADVPALQPALAALRRALARHHVVEHNLGAAPAVVTRAVPVAEGAVLVAVGPRAARAILDQAPGTRFVFLMVNDAEADLLEGRGAVGIRSAVPLQFQDRKSVV